MGIYKRLESMTRYISEAAFRIFRIPDDAYPATGVQPFSGEPVNKNKKVD